MLWKKFNPNKCLGRDILSVRMTKLCSKSTALPLKAIFYVPLQEGKSPNCWKKTYVALLRKNENKNMIKDFRPITLLPIFGKTFERIFFKDLSN